MKCTLPWSACTAGVLRRAHYLIAIRRSHSEEDTPEDALHEYPTKFYLAYSATFHEVTGAIALRSHASKTQCRGGTSVRLHLETALWGYIQQFTTMETHETTALRERTARSAHRESTLGPRWLLRGRSLPKLVIRCR